ncbi:MAG: aldehyde ferredoxin oxidoreductase family protein [Thermoleophilia bacterium]
MRALGDIVDIDLSTGAVERWPFAATTARFALGGRGLGALHLWKEVGPDVDPLGQDNVLVLATGMLTGSAAPSASRMQLSARSPLTGLLGSANIGGDFGHGLRAAGVAALVVRGSSPRPVWLHVAPGRLEVLGAGEFWGLETDAALAALNDQAGHGERLEALVIGPAGERLVPLACVMSRGGHAAGRTGLGAVFGAKNLKAVAVAAGSSPAPTNARAKTAVRTYFEGIVNAPWFPEISKYGSTASVRWSSDRGILATRNFSAGTFAQADAIDGTALQRYVQRRRGCRRCPVRCKADVAVTSGPHAGFIGQRPDFEPLAAWGATLGIGDPEAVMYLHDRCDALGLDSISAGTAAGFAVDLYARGIIDTADTGGLELHWGDAAAAGALVEGMASGEGFAGLLGQGVRAAAAALGRGAERYAAHVKGLELSAYDPRAATGAALGYAVSNRGGDYTNVYARHEFDLPDDVAVRLYGDTVVSDPLSPEGKAIMVRRSMCVSAALDGLGLCKVPALTLLNRYDLEMEAELAEAVTGLPVSAADLYLAGERIVNLERLFNLRCGATEEDDRLPVRFTEEPLPDGPGAGRTVDLWPLRHEFYEIMGWGQDGVPAPAKLAELGLQEGL